MRCWTEPATQEERATTLQIHPFTNEKSMLQTVCRLVWFERPVNFPLAGRSSSIKDSLGCPKFASGEKAKQLDNEKSKFEETGMTCSKTQNQRGKKERPILLSMRVG
jgi:hypothetical protein